MPFFNTRKGIDNPFSLQEWNQLAVTESMEKMMVAKDPKTIDA